MRAGAGLTVGLFVALVASGCQVIGGFEEFERAGATPAGTTDAGVDAPAEAGPPCPVESEPGAHGPNMVQVKRAAGTCFWIDTTEVTVADYREFLVATDKPALTEQACGTKAGPGAFLPDATCSAGLAPGVPIDAGLLDGGDADAGAAGALPQTCVDWCDALAYCRWSGKELCREESSEAAGDFYEACTEGNPSNGYGCGTACVDETSVRDACNVDDASGALADVSANTNCFATGAGGASQVFDLTGNASEWVASCKDTTGASAQCRTRGGSFADAVAKGRCDAVGLRPRDAAAAFIGFRCCAYTQ